MAVSYTSPHQHHQEIMIKSSTPDHHIILLLAKGSMHLSHKSSSTVRPAHDASGQATSAEPNSIYNCGGQCHSIADQHDS
eukprot:scaffold116057_cov19-Prasinocladus_malaysianus.AAC.1